MRMRNLSTLALLALALALATGAMAKNGPKPDHSNHGHGIGKGGVPARIADLQAQIDALHGQIDEINQFIDHDLDGFSAKQGDCDDTNAAVHPGATEIAGNAIDDNCDGNVDEATTTSTGNGHP